MTAAWASSVLRGVPDGRALAERVAGDMGPTSAAVLEVARLHLEALDSALLLEMPELLADQVRWQEVRLQAAGVAVGVAELDEAVGRVLAGHLDDDARRRVLDMHHAAAALAASGLLDTPMTGLGEGPARDYLRATLEGRRDDAVRLVREAMLADVSVADIMLEILQPAQVALGRLWERGEITVAHEHYTTAITQLSMSLLYPRLVSNRPVLGRSLVATCVGNERHDLGIRMVSDLLEQEGWRTAYLGGDVPHADVVETVAQHRADVLAVSATMAGHVRDVVDLIAVLRADERCARVRVLVGGRPFVLNPRLAAAVGADGWAPGAREALTLCHEWSQDRLDAGEAQ